MSGIYTPITNNYSNGVVSVQSTDGTTYNEIINSMGSWVYLVDEMYMKTDTINQLLSPLYFNQYDVNGTLKSFNQINAVDPYQYQKSLVFDLVKENVILSGRTSLSATIGANETIFMILYTRVLQNADYLKPTNFFNDDFFKDYAEQV